MGFKETFQQEKRDLKAVKRPYETVAFLLFALLLLQQLFYWVKNLIDFMKVGNSWFSTANILTQGNLQTFILRIINIDSSKWVWVIFGLLAFIGYYVLIYFFVWNYCKKNNLAKWTWSLFVVFGPTIFLAPPFIWFAIYVFRPYIARFAKRVVVEFKEFDPNEEFPEEVEEKFDEKDYDKYIEDEPKSEKKDIVEK